uniref:Uncharacterized protein n=1 Tax=Podoviridae sp. ct8Lf7 TaxID=2827723 RepID=A0A8S5S0M6_9CAUD|nr:MAG TPA: hypothetical protein [Podoviridae sp. ct8Lf7]
MHSCFYHNSHNFIFNIIKKFFGVFPKFFF